MGSAQWSSCIIGSVNQGLDTAQIAQSSNDVMVCSDCAT